MSAGILALVVGGFGIHRFYLGQWWGVFYLLFFWLGLPLLVAIIEGIVFLCMSQERWDEKHNEGIPTRNDGSRVALVIVLAVVGVGGIALLGILAAIAIPAYADYTARTKVAVALTTAHQAAAAVELYVEDNGALPATLVEAGFDGQLPPGVESIQLNETNGNVVVTMSGPPFDSTGASFTLSPSTDGDDGIIWQCSSIDMRERYLPRRCRSHEAR